MPVRISTVIARRFDVRFDPAQAWCILHQMGWTVRGPVRRAAERDGDAVTGWTKGWIKETWPQVERPARTRRARMWHRSGPLDGFIAESSLITPPR
jgi:hypothetical protein